MKRKNIYIALLIIAAILAASAVSSYYYLHNVFVPKKLRPMLLEALYDATGRKVSVGTIEFSLLKGATINRIKIFEADGQTEFLSVEKANFKILLLPVLKEKKIFIPRVYLESPALRVERNKDNSWNFQTLSFLDKKLKRPGKSKFSVLLYQIKIGNLTVHYKDSAVSPVFEKKLEHGMITVSMQVPYAKYQLTGVITEVTPCAVSIKGSYNFLTRSLYNVINLKDLSLEEYTPYYSKYLAFTIKRGNIDTFTKIWFDANKNLSVSTYSPIGNIHILGKNIEALGSGLLKGNFSGNLAKGGSLKYQGQFRLDGALIKGIPYAGELKNIHGDILFTHEGVTAARLTGAAYENNVSLDGSFMDYKNPVVDINIKSQDFDLARAYDSILPTLDESFQDIKVAGKSDILLNIKGPLNDLPAIVYDSMLTLRDCSVTEVSDLYRFDKLTGNIVIKNDLLISPDLACDFKGLPMTIAVSVKDLNDPQFNIVAKAQLELSNLKPLLPKKMAEKFQDIALAGVADTSLNITGKLKPEFTWDVTGASSLAGASISSPSLPEPIKNINGIIRLASKDSISSERITFTYKKTEYALAGTYANVQEPQLDFNLSFPGFNAASQLAFDKDLIKIKKCDGTYLNSKFTVIGDISQAAAPVLNLYATAALDLQDLDDIFPGKKDLFVDLDPQGKMDLTAYINGPAKDPRGLELVIKGKSDAIRLWNMKFDKPYLDLRMKEKILQFQQVSASPYNGSINATANVDFTQKTSPFTLDADILDVDLKQWIQDTQIKNKDVQGSFNAKLALKGGLEDTATYKGDGWVRVREGYLWEVPLLTGLAEVLYLTSSDRVVFKEAYGTFIVADKKITTKDLSLYSDMLKLVGQGYLDFDKNIDFDVTVNFSEGLAKKSPLSQLGMLLITSAGEFIGEIKLTGTLKEPKYKLKMFPVDKILKHQIFDRIKGIFENISK